MKREIVMIGHGHLDPVWLWEWTEGMQAVKSTFRSALDRMKEYEDFIFTCSSAAFYEFTEKSDPEMFGEIKERVAQGRWNIVGGWWVEPDCNIPCGESFARQALLGQRYFLERFGKMAETGFCPDSFGHAATLPMLLRQGGMKNYVFMRPMPGEKPLPSEIFIWRSEDGSSVNAFRIPYEYLSWDDNLREHIKRCQNVIREPMRENMCFYGVGNHGGGPTRANLELIQKLRKCGEPIACGTVEQYFENEADAFGAVVEDELQYHAPGCYSACSMIKRYNRRAENCLITAEIFCSLAQMQKLFVYPDNFNEAWKKVLYNQFHDVLAGTCIESVYEQARDFYGFALTAGRENKNYALQALSWNICIDKEENMTPVVVFHPHSFDARVPVEAELQGSGTVTVVKDPQGREIPFAVIPEASIAGRRTRIVFQAELPSAGYRTFRVYREKQGRSVEKLARKCDCLEIENEFLRLSFVRDGCGGIDRIYDKENGVLTGDGGFGIPRVMEDEANDTWAHHVYHFDNLCGTFQRTELELIEDNNVRKGVRVTSIYGDSELKQEFYIYEGGREIYVRASLSWREKSKILKLEYRPGTIFNRCICEIPYGRAERAVNGNEMCGQRWVDYTGVEPKGAFPYGIGLINDGQYSFSAKNDSFCMTVIRSSLYAHHEPEPYPEEGRRRYMDLGCHEFGYILRPYKGKMEDSNIAELAAEWNAPPEVLAETYHEGTLPMEKSYLQVNSKYVTVTALKQSESRDGYVIRCQNISGNTETVRIDLQELNLSDTLTFHPYEVKSILIYPGEENSWQMAETDFLELEQEAVYVHDHE